MTTLRERFGDELVLTENGKETETYRLLAELTLNGRRYAIVQTEAMRKEDDIDVMRIVDGPDGELQLETVEDDGEWEAVAEAYDDMQFGGDERP
jgi:uncharacterized protein YrzB (UPF0473 family)